MDEPTTSDSDYLPKNIVEENSKPREGPSECEICCRPAQGHHYGVAACKGCKTFFRRMCVSNSEVECKLNNDCFNATETKPLHLRCQACRFKKCINAGMNPSALELKDGENINVHYKKLMKRKENSEQCESKKMVITSLQTRENFVKGIVEVLTYLDLKLNQFRNSSYNPTFADYRQSSENLINCNSKLSFADEFGPMEGWPIIQDDYLPKASRMRDVPDVNLEPINLTRVQVPFTPKKKMWMFFNMITTIEYAKTFMFFHKLDLNDRIVLIGDVTLICMNLHNSYFAVSQKIQKCMQPDGTEQPRNDEYHYSVVSMSFAPLIRCDIQLVEYLLLKAICLCNPTVHGLSEHAQSILTEERQTFADVLLDYCLRNRNDGPSRFVELLGIIPVLLHQQKLQKDIHIYHISPIISKLPYTVQFLEDVMHS